MPRVSIIMGVYNGYDRMDKSIQSIIGQTYADWEFVICDDGSEDGSYEKLMTYAEKDSRFVIIKNTYNQGLAITLNRCLERVTGEYVARMDDDDCAHPDRLKKEVAFLDSNPQYDIVATGRNMVDGNGIWGRDSFMGERSNIDVFCGKTFAHPTVMIRKKAYDAVGGYSTEEGIGREEDTDLWCRMYIAGSKGYITGEPLLDYFESRTSMSRRKFKFRIAETRIKLRYRKNLGVPFYLVPFAFKPIFVGLLPLSFIEYYHHRIFNLKKH